MKLSEFNLFQGKLHALLKDFGIPLAEFAGTINVLDGETYVSEFSIPIQYDPEDATE